MRLKKGGGVDDEVDLRRSLGDYGTVLRCDEGREQARSDVVGLISYWPNVIFQGGGSFV